jgi:hypothetical protein
MPRKKIDASQHATQEYWNKLLVDYGLSVEKGRHPKLVYVGDSRRTSLISDLESTKEGRVTPSRPPSD